MRCTAAVASRNSVRPGFAVLYAVLFGAIAWGQPAGFDDLSLLKLQVEKAEVVESIPIGGGGLSTPRTMNAKPGYRMWVVTLKGSVPRPCNVAVAPAAFLAAWDKEEDWGDRKVRTMNFEVAHHVRSGDRWVAGYSTDYAKAMPEERVAIAVTLPAEVKEFRVTYATFAPGVAKQ